MSLQEEAQHHQHCIQISLSHFLHWIYSWSWWSRLDRWFLIRLFSQLFLFKINKKSHKLLCEWKLSSLSINTLICLNIACVVASITQLWLGDNEATVLLGFIVDCIIDVNAAFERALEELTERHQRLITQWIYGIFGRNTWKFKLIVWLDLRERWGTSSWGSIGKQRLWVINKEKEIRNWKFDHAHVRKAIGCFRWGGYK